MERLRKMSSKFFKKAPRPSHPPPLPSQINGSSQNALKHARSMPSYDPAVAWAKAAGRVLTPPDPIYKEQVVNKAQGNDGRHRRRCRNADKDYDSSDDENLYYGQPLSHSTISRFPHPPNTIATQPNYSPGQYHPCPSTEELIIHAPNPRYDKWAEEYIDSIRLKPYYPPIRQRSSSNASFSHPTHAVYPFTGQASTQSGASRTRPHAPTVTYKTKHRNLSVQTFSTDPVPFSRSPVPSASQPRMVNGPVAHRPIIQQSLPHNHRRAVVYGHPDSVPSRPFKLNTVNRPQGPRAQGIPPYQRLEPNRRPETP